MALSELPLSYCTNVHPGRSVAEVEAGLDKYTVSVRQSLGHPLAAGLWLAKPVTTELLVSPDGISRFAEGLRRRNLTCHTLNAFPYGDFHSARVKENVYLPGYAWVLDVTTKAAVGSKLQFEDMGIGAKAVRKCVPSADGSRLAVIETGGRGHLVGVLR